MEWRVSVFVLRELIFAIVTYWFSMVEGETSGCEYSFII